MPSLSMELKGDEQIIAKLLPEKLYWPFVKSKLDTLGKAGAMEAQATARGFQNTGRMAGGITHKLNSVPAPRWVAVTTNATSATGKRYPWILEFENRFGHRNWLLDSVRKAQAQTVSLVAKAIGEIESFWRS